LGSFSVDLLEVAVDRAIQMGASYSEARYHRREEFSIALRQDRIVSVGRGVEEGIGIRVLVNGVLSFAAVDTLSREAVIRAVETAVSRARAVSNTRAAKLLVREWGEAKVGRASYEVLEAKKFDSKSVDDKIREAKELWRVASNSVRESRVASFFAAYTESVEEKEIVTSEGAYVRSRVPRVSLFTNFVLYHPQRGTIQRSLDFGGSGGLELLNRWNVPEELKTEVVNVENVLLRGVAPPKDPVDIVVGSEVVGLIVHESAGHPMEADRIWGREGAQAGESYVKPEMLGRERIGNEHATVIDDPTIPGSFGFFLYDDEGVRARPRYLYLSGIINEPLHNRWTAYIFNTESNGAARAMNYNSEPIPRMSNTYLTPGDRSFEELIEDINFGVYIKSYMEWNIDDIRWGQRYVGLEAYIIRSGELAEPVRNPVLELTTKAFYSSIVAKTKHVKFYPGTCGKGEPSQGVPVWFGGPDVRLAKIRLGVSPV